MSRPYDVVVFGSTGFTGELTARYFSSSPTSKNIRWAVAGRNREKLNAVVRRIVSSGGSRPDGILVANSRDAASLADMARQTKVVASTVGPYMKYGRELVRACVENDTHYCDLTGEFPFVRSMIDEHHREARLRGVKIVHCAGFDCVPVDLCVMMAIDALPTDATEAFAMFSKVNGAASGGTLDSVSCIQKWARDPSHRSDVEDPYYLAPNVSSENRVDKVWTQQRGLSYSRDFNTLCVPHIMAVVDNRVVRRSIALRNQSVKFDEAMSLGAVLRMSWFGFTHFADFYGMGRPKAGDGPSKRVREDGSFRLQVLAKDDAGGRSLVEMEGEHDPGYLGTSILLAETAMCLVEERGGKNGGVLTPSTACGMALVRRLAATGHFRFSAKVQLPPRSHL